MADVMMNGLDVSVIIPVHNEERTIGVCLDSVLKQNIREIIVVLDKCEDDSEKIVKNFMKKDSRIYIYYLLKHIFKNNFYAETVNFGVSKSSKKIICIVDADTMLEQDYIKKLLIHLNEHFVSVSGIMIHLHQSFFHFHEKIRGSGRLIKKEVWDSIGGFKDVLTCDTYLELEFLKRGWKTKVIDNIIQYDLRKYTMRQLTRRAIRRGKGRRQIGQSFLFMLGHGLYILLNSPFGIVELTGNIIGYISTEKRSSEELNKIYEYNRIIEIVDKYHQIIQTIKTRI